MERPDDGCGATPVTAYAPAKRCVLLQFTWLSARCIYRPCRQATGSYRLPNSACQSTQLRSAGDKSWPLRSAQSLTSRAISSVTSRDQPSDVLKQTTRTGLLYLPLYEAADDRSPIRFRFAWNAQPWHRVISPWISASPSRSCLSFSRLRPPLGSPGLALGDNRDSLGRAAPSSADSLPWYPTPVER